MILERGLTYPIHTREDDKTHLSTINGHSVYRNGNWVGTMPMYVYNGKLSPSFELILNAVKPLIVFKQKHFYIVLYEMPMNLNLIIFNIKPTTLIKYNPKNQIWFYTIKLGSIKLGDIQTLKYYVIQKIRWKYNLLRKEMNHL